VEANSFTASVAILARAIEPETVFIDSFPMALRTSILSAGKVTFPADPAINERCQDRESYDKENKTLLEAFEMFLIKCYNMSTGATISPGGLLACEMRPNGNIAYCLK